MSGQLTFHWAVAEANLATRAARISELPDWVTGLDRNAQLTAFGGSQPSARHRRCDPSKSVNNHSFAPDGCRRKRTSKNESWEGR